MTDCNECVFRTKCAMRAGGCVACPQGLSEAERNRRDQEWQKIADRTGHKFAATPPTSPATIGRTLAAAVRRLPDLVEIYGQQHGQDAARKLVEQQVQLGVANCGICLG